MLTVLTGLYFINLILAVICGLFGNKILTIIFVLIGSIIMIIWYRLAKKVSK